MTNANKVQELNIFIEINEINDKLVLQIIKEIINNCRIKSVELSDTKYHHNSSYDKTPQILTHGILALKNLVDLGLIDLNKEDLIKYSTNDHVNGIEQISISSTDVDRSILYKGEELYNPFYSGSTDIILDSDLKAYRTTTHYYNEFLVDDSISNKKIRSVDIRLLNFIDGNLKNINGYITPNILNSIINKYNNLILISNSIKSNNLDIPLREMSQENITLDVDKLSKSPILLLK